MLSNGSHSVFGGSAATLFRHYNSSRSDSSSFERHGDWDVGSLSYMDSCVRSQIFVFGFVLAFNSANVGMAAQVLLGGERNVRAQLDVCDLRTFRAMSLFWS